jgi:hypothetical protein
MERFKLGRDHSELGFALGEHLGSWDQRESLYLAKHCLDALARVKRAFL